MSFVCLFGTLRFHCRCFSTCSHITCSRPAPDFARLARKAKNSVSITLTDYLSSVDALIKRVLFLWAPWTEQHVAAVVRFHCPTPTKHLLTYCRLVQ